MKETWINGLRTVVGRGLPGTTGPAGPAGSFEDTFETVSKNLSAADAVMTYTGEDLTQITYGGTITKTLTYGVDGLASITLSGAVPGGISLTKTLTYSGGNLAGYTYS
jgi:hypothetical protein